ncbi:hypothetical protein E2C01_057629 [Portunus trituberculatus]|uniref:Uncharacterized protein n=1 Tax=Portunus trituberculatus TaxID=210409 RepID=A0A5B7GXI8_PORTR|nr:hypothetical protein [Portunus trituberculatus]
MGPQSADTAPQTTDNLPELYHFVANFYGTAKNITGRNS